MSLFISTSEIKTPRSHRIRFALGWLAGVSLAFMLHLLLAEAQLGAPFEPVRWIAEARAIKQKAALQIPGRKLILAGGSGAHFGLSAQLFSQQMGLPAVNLGLHAGLMLDNLLEHVKAVSHSGDQLILSLEFPLYEEAGLLDPNVPWYVFAYDPAFLEQLPWQEKLRHFLSLRISRVGVGLLARLTPPVQFTSDYQSASIRPETGDETRNAKDRMTALEWAKVNHQGPVSFYTSPFQVSERARIKLQAFAFWCQHHSVSAVIAFPPTIYYSGLDEQLIRRNSDHLLKVLSDAGFAVLGRPEDFRYESSYFYDTVWHMNDTGRAKHSEYLIGLLKRRSGLE